MKVRKLRSFTRICQNCLNKVFMQEMLDGTWFCADDQSRLLRHWCIRVGGFQ